MKRPLLLTSSFIIFCLQLLAQDPFTQSDLVLMPGMTFTQSASLTAEEGTSGINQTWDFSSLSGSGENISILELGINDPENFPDADFKWCGSIAENCRFFSVGSDGYQDLGYSDDFATEAYTDPIQICPLPFSFGENYSDTYGTGDENNGIEGSHNMSVDGYGTLIMPWGEIPGTYRIHGSFQEEYQLAGTIQQTNTADLTLFFAPGYPAPIIQTVIGEIVLKGFEEPILIQSTLFLENIVLSTSDKHDVVENLRVFPNPTNGIISIQFENQSTESISVDILDLQGRTLRSEGAITNNGNTLYQTDLGDLNPGFYLLRLSNGRNFQIEKVQLVH